MQTILGANGQIGHVLAVELHDKYQAPLRLVSRHPQQINGDDELVAADLLDPNAAATAVEGSEIVYFTAGLPMQTDLLLAQWPVITKNVIAACEKHHAKLVFFDNTYMYPMSDQKQTEATEFAARGSKSVMREQLTELLLEEMASDRIEAVICRAPEFYGPDKTLSFTNAFIFNPAKAGKPLTVPASDQTKRSLIWTPDASKAMALIGNTPDAYQQTWHLPCDDDRMTYQEMIAYMSRLTGQAYPYQVKPISTFEAESKADSWAFEILELLPRYTQDNLFDSTKFKQRFPDFHWTTYREGIKTLMVD